MVVAEAPVLVDEAPVLVDEAPVLVDEALLLVDEAPCPVSASWVVAANPISRGLSAFHE